MKSCVALLFAVLILPSADRCEAQTSEAWMDYIANWSPEGDWAYELNPGFSKGIEGARWLDVYFASNATFQPIHWVSTEGNLELHYTFDQTTENVLEIRPWLGLNFIWATYGEYLNLFYPSISLRLEERYLWYQESGSRVEKTRARLRVSTRFPLNNEMLTTGTYYLLFLAETYFPLDGEIREVSADRRRFQAGLGYVVGPELRIEFQYVMMRTRNSYLNTFETSNHIFWLALRNYF